MDVPEVSYRLEDRVVIVTGASSGLGRWLAKGLDRAGARLVLTARRADRVQRVADGLRSAIAIPANIANDSDRIRLVEQAHATFGRIDGVVNSAGTLNFGRAVDETAEDVRRLLDVNVVGPFDLARRCVEHMRTSEPPPGEVLRASAQMGQQRADRDHEHWNSGGATLKKV
jgi:NAD(P)-dependent dehydrogenase (short-subunit alcohol dehydrogenase family)